MRELEPSDDDWALGFIVAVLACTAIVAWVWIYAAHGPHVATAWVGGVLALGLLFTAITIAVAYAGARQRERRRGR
jgi:hypothetical protein